jgi:hypothetical protein
LSLESSTTLYYGRIRPSWLPLRTVERKCARLDAASTSPSALAPWRCGARQPTIGLGQTVDGSPSDRLIHVKYVSAAPSGAVASRRRPIATCRQWASSRPGVTSAANHDELRSNTARYGSPQVGLGALCSGGLLHTTQMCLGRVGSPEGRFDDALLVQRGAPGAKSRRSAPQCPVKPAIRSKLSTSQPPPGLLGPNGPKKCSFGSADLKPTVSTGRVTWKSSKRT